MTIQHDSAIRGRSCVGCGRGTPQKVMTVPLCNHCEPQLVLRRDELAKAFRELLK